MNILVISDIHLCGVVPPTSWMRYRQRDFLQDDQLAFLIDAAIKKSRGPLEIVLNGDIFDFDAPGGGTSGPFSHNEANAASLIAAILNDHPRFVEVLQRVLHAGHKVIFISGNHDAQMVFPAVRHVVEAYVGPCLFKTWFHQTNGLHIEHGHLYDPLCTLESAVPINGPLENTIGSVASYFFPLLLNQVNPHASDPMALRMQVFSIVKGSILFGPMDIVNYTAVVAQLLRELALVTKGKTGYQQLCSLAARENGQSLHTVQQHALLIAPKTSMEEFIVGEKWKDYKRDADNSIAAAMTNIASLYGAKGVIFGHTHRAFQNYHNGVFYGNSGFWTPSIDMLPGANLPGTFVWCEGSSIGTYAPVKM